MRNPIMQITMKDIFLLLTLFALGNATAAPSNKPGLQDLAQGGTPLRISIDNASFEEGTNNVPNHWTPLPSTYGNLYLWDNSVNHTERRSIAIRGSRYQYGRWKSDPIDVQKAGFSFYSLTGSVKTSQNNGEVYLAIAWLDRNGARITTSDSPMLPEGDNDWQTLTVNALPPDGTVNVSIYSISNHNNGTAWFDTLKLRVTQFPAVGHKSYEQFITEHPDHPLALAAHLMRVKVLMTQAKWIKEKGLMA